MKKTDSSTFLVKKPEQRKALASPIRMEILGQFTASKPMSISEVAERMGRAAGSLYYHFQMLERVGLLRRVGSRPRGKREESLFEPVAHRFAMPAECAGPQAGDAVRTMALAFRMAERDMEAALVCEDTRAEGKDRNFFATRMHFRVTREALAELNRHLRAAERLIMREAKRTKFPPEADQYCSLTLALLPLRGRRESQE